MQEKIPNINYFSQCRRKKWIFILEVKYTKCKCFKIYRIYEVRYFYNKRRTFQHSWLFLFLNLDGQSPVLFGKLSKTFHFHHNTGILTVNLTAMQILPLEQTRLILERCCVYRGLLEQRYF